MGGRGASSGISGAPTGRETGSIKSLLQNMKSLDNYGYEKNEKEETQRKLPTYGDKVQSAYIEYVKKQTGIDLTPARDTYFDNRKGFNIDTRALSPSDLNQIKRLAKTYPGGYDVRFAENGATRLYIAVERKKRKK